MALSTCALRLGHRSSSCCAASVAEWRMACGPEGGQTAHNDLSSSRRRGSLPAMIVRGSRSELGGIGPKLARLPKVISALAGVPCRGPQAWPAGVLAAGLSGALGPKEARTRAHTGTVAWARRWPDRIVSFFSTRALCEEAALPRRAPVSFPLPAGRWRRRGARESPRCLHFLPLGHPGGDERPGALTEGGPRLPRGKRCRLPRHANIRRSRVRPTSSLRRAVSGPRSGGAWGRVGRSAPRKKIPGPRVPLTFQEG